jgi:hypothetical protein
MTTPDPWQAPDAARAATAGPDASASPWTAPPMQTPMQQHPSPYSSPWPGAFTPPPSPRQPMSRGRRALLISLAVVVGLLLVGGAATLGVLVARDAANESAPAAPSAENSALLAAIDELDEDTTWTLAEEVGGADEFEAWAARLYSSSGPPERSKDTAVTMLQGADYTNIVVMQYIEPQDSAYEWVVNGEKDTVYASVYIGSDIQYEYTDDGGELSVEAPVGGSAINVHLSDSSASATE